MRVSAVEDGTRVQPNAVYVIPPNAELSILNGVLQLLEPSQPRGSNLPIDCFFRALAQDQGENAICIILSGTGTDGTLGLKAVKGALGMAMVQRQDTAKYDGMPRSAIATGLVDYELSPRDMPRELIRYARHAIHEAAPGISLASGGAPDSLQKIFIILRDRTGQDFSLYKKNTICRRIERRMSVHQIDSVDEYETYLRESANEADTLVKELLIGVTNFFRDPEAFDVLRNGVLPGLLADKPDDYTVRVWVPGCSSGEEAYSLAIVLHECMEKLGRRLNVQIFGTDIDEDAIAAARAGLYPQSIMADVSPDRLERYFSREPDGQYRIGKMIRELLVFAPQNLIKDPPFTKLDLLSCRNLLIYLDARLQRKILPIFHYSLNHDGVLFLGSSETIGRATDLFTVVDRRWKIFRRDPAASSENPGLTFPAASGFTEIQEAQQAEASGGVLKGQEISALRMVEAILDQSESAPCAVIDEAFNAVYIHGRTGRFLEPAEGRASLNILEMARPGLRPELSAAIRRAASTRQEVVQGGVRVGYEKSDFYVDLTVKPILDGHSLHGMMLVAFQETERPEPEDARRAKGRVATRKQKTNAELEHELESTRENLQLTIEELETSNEEMKSTNEELQSTNEELETSKEELQSLNEESSTVNIELQSRIDELSKANDDIQNLLDSTNIATLFLDNELNIRRFTPGMTVLLPLEHSDSGRPVNHFASNLLDVDLEEKSRRVLRDLQILKLEVASRDGKIFSMSIRPYRTMSNVVDGVVLTFEDVTEARTESGLRERADLERRTILDAVSEVITYHDDAGVLKWMNRAAADELGPRSEDALGRKCHEMWGQSEESSKACPGMACVAIGEPREAILSCADGKRWHVEARPMLGRDGNLTGFIEVRRLAESPATGD